ncbi:hypothetical protein BRDID11002_20060 [Bradyrhizobium diazoefficiens]
MIFTNYQFYVDAFAQLCQQRLQSGEAGLDAFVAPGNVITRSGGATSGDAPTRTPQMPAFHLVEPGYRGISSDQHRHRPVQCAQRHRPRRGAAPRTPG